MNKIKNIFLLLFLGVVIIYSCDEQNPGLVNPFAGVNYEELAISDNDSIVAFLKSHYYDITSGSIKELTSGNQSIFEDSNLKIKEITNNDINYKLYTYVATKGNPKVDKGVPSIIDSVFTNYTGVELLNNDLDTAPFDSGERVWLTNTITGWANGFTNFKGGDNITNNGPIIYENTGKGYIFIPSGLAYPSIDYVLGQQIRVPYDRILTFKIELLDFVKDTDHDNDGTPSIQEDADGNGDPRNDFSDANSPGLPDYLNPNIK